MICTKCGASMDQTDKNTFTGRVIREYKCRKCGHSDWEDDGVALWQVLHDANMEAAHAAPAQPEPQSSQQRPASFWQRLTGLFLRKE